MRWNPKQGDCLAEYEGIKAAPVDGFHDISQPYSLEIASISQVNIRIGDPMEDHHDRPKGQVHDRTGQKGKGEGGILSRK